MQLFALTLNELLQGDPTEDLGGCRPPYTHTLSSLKFFRTMWSILLSDRTSPAQMSTVFFTHLISLLNLALGDMKRKARVKRGARE